MSPFERLLACFLSGQLTERQIAAELRDPDFAAYYKQRVSGHSLKQRTT